jgi:hypothetical protein
LRIYSYAVKKADRRNERRRKAAAARYLTVVKWIAGLGVVALLVYATTEMAGVAYDENAIGVVNFSNLTSSAKRGALRAANRARCACGCGMTLAQCVATDSTCPIRETNIDRIKTMVREAEQP